MSPLGGRIKTHECWVSHGHLVCREDMVLDAYSMPLVCLVPHEHVASLGLSSLFNLCSQVPVYALLTSSVHHVSQLSNLLLCA